MNKRITLIPALLLLPCLFFSNNKAEKVSATDAVINDGLYFVISYDNTYGLKASNSTLSSSVAVADQIGNLSIPFTFTRLNEDNDYVISCVVENITTYFSNQNASNTRYNSNSDNSQWRISSNGDGTYEIHASKDTFDRKYLYYYSSGSTHAFRVSDSGSSSNDYKIRLLSVEESTSSLVTTIKNIDCSTHNPSNSDWEKIESVYNALPAPIKNYLKIAPCNKNASDTTLEWALAKYDYVCGKYHESRGFDDYLVRNPEYPTDSNIITINMVNN